MMPPNFLEDIVAHKRNFLAERSAYYATLKKKLEGDAYTRYRLFKKQITRPDRISLIAEIKKASPSKGLIREDFDALEIARIYAKSKADAISILTEEKFFLGKPMYIKKVSEEINVPILAKDFFVDEVQIYEARLNGASAVLLIVAILDAKALTHLMKVASGLDLDCLVEVHDEKELGQAVSAGAEIIGVNNRDLTSFHVDLKACEKLIPKIPKGITIVAESGINQHKDVEALRKMGAHAVLIGEAFMRERDIAKKIKDVMYGEHAR